MTKTGEDQSRRGDWHELAKVFGADVQRLLVFFSLYENAFVQGALSGGVKHLIALAMSIGTRTNEGIAYHIKEALAAGASADEIRETVTVAVLGAGVPSLLSGMEALAVMRQHQAEKMIAPEGKSLSPHDS